MNCTKCGKEIPEGDNKLCEDCQKKLVEELAQEEKEENVVEKEAKKEKVKENKKKNKEEKTENKSEEKSEKCILKKMNKTIIAICAIVVVIAIAACIYIVLNSNSSNVGNTIGNIRNYGYGAISGNYIYYLAPNEDSTKVGIFKVRKDGKNIENLYMTEEDIVAINVYKNHVYFIGVSETDDENTDDDYDNKIYKMDLDGGNLTVINDNNFSNDCYEIYVLNDSVYYIGLNGEIAKMDLNGENAKTIIDTTLGYLGVTEDYIIYKVLENENDEDYVTYIADIDGSNPRPIIEGTRLYSVNIEGDYIYYSNEDKEIYRTKIDSNEEELIYSTEAYNLNVNNGYAYYLNYKDPDNEDYTVCLFKVNLNADEKQEELVKELSTYSTFLDIVGKWAIYMDSDDDSGFINLVNLDGSGEEVRLYELNYEEYYNSVSSDEDEYEESYEIVEDAEETDEYDDVEEDTVQ